MYIRRLIADAVFGRQIIWVADDLIFREGPPRSGILEFRKRSVRTARNRTSVRPELFVQ
jgi:hypothetical protein